MKNTLKDLGMEKEFKNWLVDIKNKNKDISINERVELIKPKSYANILKGSAGTVIYKRDKKPSGDYIISVEFDCRPKTIYHWYRSRFRSLEK